MRTKRASISEPWIVGITPDQELARLRRWIEEKEIENRLLNRRPVENLKQTIANCLLMDDARKLCSEFSLMIAARIAGKRKVNRE